jgi:hypothetical protein
VALAAIGTLVVFATAVAAGALQGAVGIVGTGLAILLFVVLGNPSSGGPYAPEMLPGFWSSIGRLLPPGAGTTLIKNTIYFSANDIGTPLLVLLAYSVAGIGVMLLFARESRGSRESLKEFEKPHRNLLISGLLLSYVARRIENGLATPNLRAAAASLLTEDEESSEEERSRIAARQVLKPLSGHALLAAEKTDHKTPKSEETNREGAA